MPPPDRIAVPVSNKPHLTSYVFYHYLIPTLHGVFVRNRHAKVGLDLFGIETLSPQAIAGLLCVGEILRRYYDEPVELLLEWKPKLLGELRDFGFFELASRRDLFAYDEEMLGGMPVNSADRSLRILELHSGPVSSADELADLMSLRYERTLASYFSARESARSFARTVGELVHNAITHGGAPCYLSAYGHAWKGLVCAVFDTGIGFVGSHRRKLDDLRLFSPEEMCLDDGNEHYRGIIEAAFRRLASKTFGLASTIDDITSKSGTVRLHSVNTQVVLTRKTWEKLVGVDRNHREFVDSLIGHLRARSAFAPGSQQSPLRTWQAKLSGVHIEFEIPAPSSSRKAHRR